ncbi:MAG: hypothetical protein FJ207_05055 [Gemmatimonadetes bacterium]|nr:hypothetical protein [Gemmatimonadota bacterium]
MIRVARALRGASAALLLIRPGLAAQTGSFEGRVADDHGRPLAGAEVAIDYLGLRALALQDGSYVLTDVPAGTHTLSARHVGHLETQRVGEVAPRQISIDIDFLLRAEQRALEEPVVAGGPRPTTRRAIGGVTTLNVPDLVDAAPASSLQDVLTGRVPGIRYTRLTGIVGTGSPFTLREMGSFAGARTRPLVYLDGIRVGADPGVGPNIGSGRSASALDDFGLEEVERIEVLRGPATASLYGTEGASGVVHLLTKKGREGPPEFTISIREGQNFLTDPAGRLGTMYFCPTQPISSATLGIPCTDRSQLQPYNMYDEANLYLALGYGKGDAWLTDRLYSNGLSRGYDLQARGGTEAIRYFVSTNYDHETGYVFYNRDETFRVRANVGVDFSERLGVELSTGFVDGSTTFGAATIVDGGEWTDLVWSNGYYLDRNSPFGTLGRCPQGTGQAGCAPNPRLGGFQEHLPSDIAEDVEATRAYQRFTGSAALSFTSGDVNVGGVAGSLESRLLVGVDRGWDVNRNWFRREDGVAPSWLARYCSDAVRRQLAPAAPSTCPVGSWNSVYTETATGEMTYERPVHSDVSVDWRLTASVRPGARWSFATSIGAQYYARSLESFSNTGQGF